MDSLIVARLIRAIDLTLDWADEHEPQLDALDDEAAKGEVTSRLVGFMDEQGLVIVRKEHLDG